MATTAAQLGAWDLLERLRHVWRAPFTTSEAWRADCPACGSAGALLVAERDRELLVECLGGCSRSRVLSELGLSEPG